MPSATLQKECSGWLSSTPVQAPPTKGYDTSASAICAKLVTTNKEGRREALLLSFDRPLTIGRNPTLCSYVISDIVVSSLHCKLYAVRSSDGNMIVSCQDMSTNGIILNGQKIRKSSVLLMDGDIIKIPSSQEFECVHIHLVGCKTNIFDPTPPRQQTIKTKSIGKYTITSHCLGSGSFATVHLAMDTSACRQVACKSIVRKERKNDKVMKEVQILLSLNHPNINRVWEAHYEHDFTHIFLQLCTGGDLFSYIINHTDTGGRLCEGEAKYIMYQMFRGLKYLHDREISHRDLKPENILLYSPGPYPRIQIADFGLARLQARQKTLNVCGTIPYLPPEGILALANKDMGYVGMPSDCWSAGVIMYIMLAGSHPFDYGSGANESEWDSGAAESETWDDSQASIRSDGIVKKRIVSGELDFPRHIWCSLLDARDLCIHLLNYSFEERATVYDALESDWIVFELRELETAYHERISLVAENGILDLSRRAH